MIQRTQFLIGAFFAFVSINPGLWGQIETSPISSNDWLGKRLPQIRAQAREEQAWVVAPRRAGKLQSAQVRLVVLTSVSCED